MSVAPDLSRRGVSCQEAWYVVKGVKCRKHWRWGSDRAAWRSHEGIGEPIHHLVKGKL
ncbi:MAG: hypothetical protein GDA56_25105 [Hormoscilla sp. GM7CHS1pb]|nr:hypothetical protein [Hormoscilla sp. GM7CHS1pb]